MNSVITNPKDLEKTVRPRGTEDSFGQGNVPSVSRATLWGHIQIARVDHWFKNVFVFPGVVVAIGLNPTLLSAPGLSIRLCLGLLAICLVASSNYVINEGYSGPQNSDHEFSKMRPWFERGT